MLQRPQRMHVKYFCDSRCSVALQHTWTYKPLVADVLGLSLNRVTVPAPPGQPGVPAAAPKSYEVRLLP